MAKIKALMMDAENAVLDVAEEAWNNIKSERPGGYGDQFINNVIQLLKDKNHPLAESEAVEFAAHRYLFQDIYGYDLNPGEWQHTFWFVVELKWGETTMSNNIVQVDQTRNEEFGKFYNVLGLVKGKYGRRIKTSRWEILYSGLGTEFQVGRRYFTIKLVWFNNPWWEHQALKEAKDSGGFGRYKFNLYR